MKLNELTVELPELDYEHEDTTVQSIVRELLSMKRFDDNPLYVYVQFRTLRDDYGFTDDDIRRATNSKNTSIVKRIFALEQLKPRLVEALRKGQISFDTAIRTVNNTAAIDTDWLQDQVIELLGIQEESGGRVFVSRKTLLEIKHSRRDETLEDIFAQVQKPDESDIDPDFLAGVESYKNGESLPVTASPMFVDGWLSGYREQ